MKRTLISLACCQVMSLSMAVHAEEIIAGSNLLSLDEMVVTTRKREETLQEVPTAITAFSAQLIEDAGIQNIEDIALMTPGFTYTPLFGGRVGNPVIRGMNTTIGEPNVGFFLDGVYQESRGAMEALFGDEIERIEVAKGPQSALYGRNTFAGAINYVTKQPSNDTEGKLEVTLGNEGRKDVRVSHSGAITDDTLFYRVGGMHSGFDGFYDNELTGGNLDEKQSNVVSLSLLALPLDNLEMVFRIGVENTNDGDDAVQFVDNNSGFTSNFLIPPNALGPGHPGVQFNDFQTYTGDLPSLTDGFAVTQGGTERDNISTSFRLDWDLDQVTLTSITGYNDLELDIAYDSDFSAQDIRFTEDHLDQNEFSQELRLTSVEQAIRWMAGVYFYDLDKETMLRDAYVPGATLGPLATSLAPSLLTNSDESTRNWAVFGSLGFDLTDQLALTIEGRYAYEKKEVDVVDEILDGTAAGTVGTFNDSASFKSFTPKVALDYQLTESSMLYGSVAKAVKSGGFNTSTTSGAVAADERTYDEETSMNYEVGVKTSWLDNRLTANLAVFYIKWDDQIVRSLGSNGAVLNENAGESSSRGFELELAAKPAKNWDVLAGLAYTDAHYDSYTFAALAPLGINPVFDGNQMPYVSEWTANSSVQYSKPAAISGFDWKLRMDAMYQSEKTGVAIDNPPLIPSRTIVNLRSGLDNGKYAVNVWVKNLFDNDDALGAVGIANPAEAANFGVSSAGYQRFQSLTQAPAERTYGITASVKF